MVSFLRALKIEQVEICLEKNLLNTAKDVSLYEYFSDIVTEKLFWYLWYFDNYTILMIFGWFMLA